MLQSLLKAAGGLATLSVAVFASLVGALYHFQRNLIFPRPDNGNPLPIRKGQLVTVDVSREARPEGVREVRHDDAPWKLLPQDTADVAELLVPTVDMMPVAK